MCGGDDEILKTYVDIFNCQIGHFPMKYLGAPVSFSCLRGVGWDFMVSKYIKRCDTWIGNSTSSGGGLLC